MEYIIKINDKKIYEALMMFLKSMKVQVESKPTILEDEKVEWETFSNENLTKAFSNDEPEYTESMVKEANPDYERR